MFTAPPFAHDSTHSNHHSDLLGEVEVTAAVLVRLAGEQLELTRQQLGLMHSLAELVAAMSAQAPRASSAGPTAADVRPEPRQPDRAVDAYSIEGFLRDSQQRVAQLHAAKERLAGIFVAAASPLAAAAPPIAAAPWTACPARSAAAPMGAPSFAACPRLSAAPTPTPVRTVLARSDAWARPLVRAITSQIPQLIDEGARASSRGEWVRTIIKTIAPQLPRVADESIILARIEGRDFDEVWRYLASVNADHVAHLAREMQKRPLLEAAAWMRSVVSAAHAAASTASATAPSRSAPSARS